MKKGLRLKPFQISAIKETASEVFGSETKVIIFGSRTDLSRRGGDIDILILTKNLENAFKKKLKFLAKLYSKIGEQKIDVIITDKPRKDIEKTAVETGIEL